MNTFDFLSTDIIADIVLKNTWDAVSGSVPAHVFRAADSYVKESVYGSVRNLADIPGNISFNLYRGTNDAIYNLTSYMR